MKRVLNKKVLFGLYNDEEILKDAVIHINKDDDAEIMDVYSPFPVHGLDPLLGLSESRIHIAGFIYGITGTIIAFSFMTWVFTADWPIIFGGKPYFSAPAFIPITFEFTVLMASVGMVVTFYLVNGLGFGVENPYLHDRITDDKFCIAFDITHSTKEQIQALSTLLEETSAEEVHTKDI
ncbi:MAG: DUF3341 domain-containing protein [Saprospiraceae bacterium]|nr:DUF3341 domain-containing protein [Saprospiraceae bacterium]